MPFKSQAEIFEKYFRSEMFPTIFCQGCGIGQVMSYTAHAFHELNIDVSKLVLVSGIGCSSRAPAYFKATGLHTTHGRALTFATGIKLVNPQLTVVVFSGDGDSIGIGGNHFLHALQRNVDITVIIMNNFNYGMTGGQASPTTPLGAHTATTSKGSVEHPIDIARLAALLNAPYVARWTTAHPSHCVRSITKGIKKKGFSVIEILTQCPTNFGRKNSLRTAVDSIKSYQENTMILDEKLKQRPFELWREAAAGNMVIGEFLDIERPTFEQSWAEYCSRMEDHNAA